MSVVLVNGDGNPAVYASQDADLLGGIGGQETGILDINDKFAATIADANTVKISSGVCITKEGRRIQIDVGDVEEVVVPTGSQGTTKYYIIGFHLYTDGSGNQLAETFIDEVESSTATITEKMFKDGETEVYVSLYRITRNGLNLEGLTLILPEIGSLAGGGIIGNTDISGIADGTVTGAIAQINTDLSDVGEYEYVGDLVTNKLKLYANGSKAKVVQINYQLSLAELRNAVIPAAYVPVQSYLLFPMFYFSGSYQCGRGQIYNGHIDVANNQGGALASSEQLVIDVEWIYKVKSS